MVNDSEAQKTVQWLCKAIEAAANSAQFCVEGSLPGVDPELSIDGIGPIRLPLEPASLEALKSVCRVAPFGKGTETVVDKEVRDSLELDASQFSLGAKWTEAIDSLMNPIAVQLGLPSDRLEAKLYKLLVYETGGFFLSHRDSEKYDRMVASLVVVLPNSFEARSMTVTHGSNRMNLDFREASHGKCANYAAFFADCLHCVDKISKGVRLSLTYNLILKSKPKSAPAQSTIAGKSERIAEAITAWVKRLPTEPLVFPLEHLYTQQGLALDLLKGNDRNLGELVAESAKQASCIVHFAHVVRTSFIYANYGIHEKWYFRDENKDEGDEDRDDFREAGFVGAEWTNERGRKQPWGQIYLSGLAMMTSKDQSDWTKIFEDYEPWFGNHGHHLKRWYFQSAMIVWSGDHHYEIVGTSLGFGRMHLFCAMVQKLSKTPKDKFDDAHGDCVRFAQAIMKHWPKGNKGFNDWKPPRPEKSPMDDFAKALIALDEQKLISAFLTMIAVADDHLSLSEFILDSCKKFGWTAFSAELRFLASRDIKRGGDYPGEISFRNMEWLSDYCCFNVDNLEKAELSKELCTMAASRYRQREDRMEFDYDVDDVIKADPVLTPNISDASLPFLIKAIVATEGDQDLADLIRVIIQFQDHFRMEACQAPTLKEVIPWVKKKLGTIPDPLSHWLNFVRTKLSLAIARKPKPPSSWARKGELCRCPICENVDSFMFNPTKKVFHYSGTEYTCRHIMTFYGYGDKVDVKYSLKKTGKSFRITLTKTNNIYEQDLARYERTAQLLADLSELDK